MNKFVTALLRLLGGLMVALALPLAAAPRTTPQEPIPTPIWTIEEVAVSGYANALAIDPFNRPHLLYVDPVSGALRYAVREYAGWHYETVANESVDLPYLAFDLQIGPDDWPCLVYATEKAVAGEPSDTKLVYGCRGPAGWELATIDDGGRTPNLALDQFGKPSIALVQGRDAVYLTREGEQWRKDVVGTDADDMNQVLLLLNRGGWPAVIYRGAHGQFRADREWNGVWFSTPLDGPTIYAAQVFDSVDVVWLAVNDGEAASGHPPFFLARLKLVEPSDSGPDDWETIDEAYDWQIAVDLALDSYPHLAYLAPDGALQYLWWDDEGRHNDSPPARGDSEVSLVLSYDQAFIAFADANRLQLATRHIVWLDESVALPFVVGSP
jgi:hypothetical protein